MRRSSLGIRWALLTALGVSSFHCGGESESTNHGRAGSGGTSALPGAAGQSTDDGGTAGHGGTGGATRTYPCTNPQLGEDSGLIACEEGYLHRPEAKRCAGKAAGGAGGGAPSRALCPNPQSYGGGTDYCDTCETDSDCLNDQICMCVGEQGACVPSNCKTDADCGEGLLCASYHGGCGDFGFACQTASDECSSDDDCGSAACAFGVVGGKEDRRACDDTVCGRPFVVEASARVAPAVVRRDWSSEAATPDVRSLTAAERATLAEHWTRLGQMEHASIAAFARFQLQLLSLGAPAALVEACTRALADETEHTKLCFDLASAYAGRRLGPGPLDVAGSLAASSLPDVVDLVIVEGCYGETSAALEAFEAAQSASDPLIAATYARIARDEQRHAELAFRFVAWALQQYPELVTSRITDALREPRAHAPELASLVEDCFRAALASRAAA